jgi:hypothetical protein
MKMNEHQDAFEQKMQRLRHTGAGGVTVAGNEAYPSPAKIRQGDRPPDMRMKVDGGWAVMNPISKKKPSQTNIEKRISNDGPVKVFAFKNMEATKTAAELPKADQPDTEESIIKQIIVLQRKLAALKEK